MKRILLAAAALLLAAGAVTAAHAATTDPAPSGVQVSHMTYQPGIHLPGTQLPRVRPVNGTLRSQNWAGYVDIACRTCALRFVAASFTLPSVNCVTSPNGSFASFWVGLDGVTDKTVEQIGTVAQCSGGTASYAAFYEMFPSAPVVFTGVSPGDAISVSVFFNAGTARWQLALADVTTRGSISTALACPSGSTCRNASAEVITEDPSSSSGQVPLVDFGQAGYQAIHVTSRGGLHGVMASTSLWTTDAINMLDSAGHNLALPGPVYGGQAFQTAWFAAK